MNLSEASTVADLLVHRSTDDAPSLATREGTWSWRRFVSEAAVRAAMVRGETGPDGGPPHVGVLLDNTAEYMAWIGAAALGAATIVGINPTRRGDELAADVRHTDCSLVVTDAGHLPSIEGLDLGLAPERLLVVGGDAYEDRRAAAGDADPEPRARPEARLLLLFTSGSTSAPKAVVCSQGRFARTVAITTPLFGITRTDVCYQSMPLFHGNALLANWAMVLGAGATMALAPRFSARGFLPDVRDFGATYFNYVGRALAYVLATPEGDDDADNALRLGFGTEASALDMERFSTRFGCRLVEGYGSSEGAIAITRRPEMPAQALGKPRDDDPGLDVIIADPETGVECPRAVIDPGGRLLNPGEAIGEIVNRAGAAGFEGYYRNPEATAERIRGGWYWSGDLGYRDAEGWFYFAGRNSDWLRVDSENFAAAPVERILARFPGVVMVAVYPVPDPRTGDQVMAALELAPGVELDPEELRRFLSSQDDLGTKWEPRFVRVVGSMPLTGTNKVRKQPLRAEHWRTSDPVFWRDAPGDPYRELTRADRAAWEDGFHGHGRTDLLDRA